MLVIWGVVILTPFLWDFFFFHCIVLQISMRFEMTFLIKYKMEKKQACKFWPLLLHRLNKIPVVFREVAFNHLPFLQGLGGGAVLNLRCKTFFVTINCINMCGSFQSGCIDSFACICSIFYIF